MNLSYKDFPEWIRGQTISNYYIERGPEYTRDVLILSIADTMRPDLIIDSRTADHRIILIDGELSWLKAEVIDAYVATSYYEGEYVTHTQIQTSKGDVCLVWRGEAGRDDVEIRTC